MIITSCILSLTILRPPSHKPLSPSLTYGSSIPPQGFQFLLRHQVSKPNLSQGVYLIGVKSDAEWPDASLAPGGQFFVAWDGSGADGKQPNYVYLTVKLEGKLAGIKGKAEISYANGMRPKRIVLASHWQTIDTFVLKAAFPAPGTIDTDANGRSRPNPRRRAEADLPLGQLFAHNGGTALERITIVTTSFSRPTMYPLRELKRSGPPLAIRG